MNESARGFMIKRIKSEPTGVIRQATKKDLEDFKNWIKSRR